MSYGAVLIDRILLDATAVDMQDDYSLWDAANDFVHWAVRTAYLHPGEFPENVYNLNKVSFYIGDVENGGHKQFAQNSGWQSDTIKRVTIGLAELKADGFSDIFGEFCQLMDNELEIRNPVLNEMFGDPPPAIDKLDIRFYALGGAEKVLKCGAIWLRSLPNLTLLSSDELAKEQAAIIARNTMFEARRTAQTD